MKQSPLILALLLLLSFKGLSQSDDWNLKGFTEATDIIILDDFSETTELHKSDLIFSKAKGFFSFSPINNINNRAMRKLKTEASMRGGSHIFITNQSIENSVFSKTSMYTARVLKSESLSKAAIEQAVNGKKLIKKMELNYARNGWKAQMKDVYEISNLNANMPIIEKNGKMYISLRNLKNSKNGLSSVNQYEVIAIEDNKILILVDDGKNNEISLFGLMIE
ncbi:hypothetical protein ACFOUP_03865 [Belliella kenyensis]|uniref:Uncharacterized protein n=1 Tax=Belliella kenyensis TaxID=1472724 RepID=A0ABV8EIN6_9BACT|nr:hypothetical protein [Belliella kenyensis]MCH7403678.1 hypothetical protein [Belliella kenyensis]MDN3603445.1 hypothetical protein [Belliella kenyensis]